MHPIQFALVQFFEGYWGTARWAQRARKVRILHHIERYQSFHAGLAREANKALSDADAAVMKAVKEASEATSPEEEAKAYEAADQARLLPETRVRYLSIADESRRLAAGYPDTNRVGDYVEYDDIMPTRLGNVLRKYERQAGSQYGLDAVSLIQQISFVAPTARLAYVGDQRQLLDLSVRMSATSIVATLIAISALWRHGAWLLLALVPYGVAYISYRGAVVVAHEYGAAVAAMIDLDRFALYDALRMRRPKNTTAERRRNTSSRTSSSSTTGRLSCATSIAMPGQHRQPIDGHVGRPYRPHGLDGQVNCCYAGTWNLGARSVLPAAASKLVNEGTAAPARKAAAPRYLPRRRMRPSEVLMSLATTQQSEPSAWYVSTRKTMPGLAAIRPPS